MKCKKNKYTCARVYVVIICEFAVVIKFCKFKQTFLLAGCTVTVIELVVVTDGWYV